VNEAKDDPSGRPAVISARAWMVVVIAAALGIGLLAALRMDRSGRRERLGGRAEYNIDQYLKIDPELIGYVQQSEFALPVRQPRGVAVGPEDRVYVAGDRVVCVLEPDGRLLKRIPLEDAPLCLAVGGPEHRHPGRIYVGMKDHVQPLTSRGEAEPAWERLEQKAHVTSIALGREDVFVADAGHAVVLRYDSAGKLLGRIGRRDAEHGIPGLVIPSPFFDVAVAPDGLVWVVNPGAQRLEAYGPEGDLEMFWGEGKAAVDGFFGCCNPAHIAVLPDGRIVTAEKGLLRVKVYSAEGALEWVVAGPEQLGKPRGGASRLDREFTAVDVAADSQGRVWVLDLTAPRLRVFVPKRKEDRADATSTTEQTS